MLFARTPGASITEKNRDQSRFGAQKIYPKNPVTRAGIQDAQYFSLQGDCENPDSDPNTIEITYSHPKDNRWDLKRFVLSRVYNQQGIPLFVKTLSGNASDKISTNINQGRLLDNIPMDKSILTQFLKA